MPKSLGRLKVPPIPWRIRFAGRGGDGAVDLLDPGSEHYPRQDSNLRPTV